MPGVQWTGQGNQFCLLEGAPSINPKWQTDVLAATLRHLSKLTPDELDQWDRELVQPKKKETKQKKRKQDADNKQGGAAAAGAASSSSSAANDSVAKKPRVWLESEQQQTRIHADHAAC